MAFNWQFQDEIKFAIMPRDFPSTIFTMQFVEDLNETLSEILERYDMQTIISMKYERGYCRVVVQDIFTAFSIIYQITNMAYENMPLMVRPLTRIPRCVFAAFIPGVFPMDYTILQRINRYNQNISTSYWNIVNIVRHDQNQSFIQVEVDAENANKILSSSNIINFELGPINIELIHVANI